MSFRSYIPSKMKVIGDHNADVVVQAYAENPEFGRGLDESCKTSIEGFSTSFNAMVPREEWNERIEEMDRKKMWLDDLVDDMIDRGEWTGPRVLNQRNLPYCWVFGVTYSIMLTRAKQGEKYIPLSPTSVGAKVKNFRAVGGWGSEAMAYIREHGLVPQELWPETALDRKYDTTEADASRKHFKCDEWWRLQPRNMDQLISCLLQNIPVAVAFNWWSHLVCATRVYRIGENTYAIGISNSWGTGWSNGGRGILKDSKMIPDEATAPRTVTASDWK